VGDVTVVHLKESVLTKSLRKLGTVSLGEKVQTKLQKRTKAIGRKVNHKRHYDEIFQAAMKTLLQSQDRLDRAIFFVEEISRGNAIYLDVLRRDQKLCLSFQSWKKKVERILMRARRPAIRKLEHRIATEKKLKAVFRESRTC
jgi:hypothetical protein